MRPQILFSASSNESTPNEPWTDRRPMAHWYNASADFALRLLRPVEGQCLVIGSPLFEATELADAGWDVTYLDVRKPLHLDSRISFVQHDACSLPFPDACFDAISTSCVLCHAGMGRYGDPVIEDGDELILGEIKRVLKPRGLAAVTFGPVIDQTMMMRFGNMQRVYTLTEARRMISKCDLKEERTEVLNAETGVISADHQPRRSIVIRPDGSYELGNVDYLSMLLRKSGE